MKKKNKRLITILIFMAFFAFGCAILLFNLRENLIFFYSPTEVFEKQIETTQMIRVGGMVKDESLVKKIKTIEGRQLEEISFVITDFENELVISYIGILPLDNLNNKSGFSFSLILYIHKFVSTNFI